MPSSDSMATSQPHAGTLGSHGRPSIGTSINLIDLKQEVIQALQEAKTDNEQAKLLANAEYYRVIIEKLLDPQVKLIREPRS